MGFRGLVRDAVFIYLGLRMLTGLVWSLSNEELVIFGFTAWFTGERLGLIPK